MDVSVGMMPLRWGPGYVGGMLLSDEVGSIPQVKLEKGFQVPGFLGHHLGPLSFTQVFGEFLEANDPTAPSDAQGTRRYLSARRLETAGDTRFHLSLAEALMNTRLPDPIYSQVLPYYLYQNDWTAISRHHWLGSLIQDSQPNYNWSNYFADVNLSYRADGRGTILYVDYALDDIKAPFGLGDPNNTTTPRKLGQQYGIYLPNLDGAHRYTLRLEYSTSDRETYTNVVAPLIWARGNVPLGYPGGPNARLLFSRLEARVSEKVKVAVEAETRQRGVTLPDTNEPDVNRFGLYASYDLRRDVFLGGRYEYQKTMPQIGNTNEQSRFELNIAVGI
jgi:hypothetical protein